MNKAIQYPNPYSYRPLEGSVDVESLMQHLDEWLAGAAKGLRRYTKNDLLGNVYVFAKDGICVEILSDHLSHKQTDGYRSKWVGLPIAEIRRQIETYFQGASFHSDDYRHACAKRQELDIQIGLKMLYLSQEQTRAGHGNTTYAIEFLQTEIKRLQTELEKASEEVKRIYCEDYGVTQA